MITVKVFKIKVKGQVYNVETSGTDGKVLFKGIKNVKYESTNCYGSNVIIKCRSKVTVTRLNNLVLTERYCHKEYTCEI